MTFPVVSCFMASFGSNCLHLEIVAFDDKVSQYITDACSHTAYSVSDQVIKGAYPSGTEIQSQSGVFIPLASPLTL